MRAKTPQLQIRPWVKTPGGCAALLPAKAWILGWVGVYSGLFLYIYRVWAAPTYEIFGLVDRETSILPVLFAFGVIALIGVTLPVTIGIYSRYFAWMIYLLVLIPSLLTISVMGSSYYNCYSLIASLAFSFQLMLRIPQSIGNRRFITLRQIDQYRFFIPFFVIYGGLLFVCIYSFHSVMSFAGLDDIYEQRAKADYFATGSTVLMYLVSWLGNALNPYLIAIGLLHRRHRWMAGLGIVGQLAVYSMFASKGVLAGIAAMIGLAVFGLKNDRPSVIRILLAMSLAMVVVLAVLSQTNFEPEGLSMALASVLYMRTFAVQGALTGVHAEFFASNPYTYGSHINGINWFVHYPYNEPLGFVIGRHLAGVEGFNSNSNFWATDGIAGFGNVGIILIGAIIGVALSFVDRTVTPRHLPFAAVVSIPYLMSLCNVSFFTSLITGGGLLLVFLIAYGVPSYQDLVMKRRGQRAGLRL